MQSYTVHVRRRCIVEHLDIYGSARAYMRKFWTTHEGYVGIYISSPNFVEMVLIFREYFIFNMKHVFASSAILTAKDLV